MSINCINCGYDLTGTPLNGQCPECGLSAAVSHESAIEARSRKPISPAAWTAIALCGAGSLSALAIVLWTAFNGGALDVFALLVSLWNASPFLGLAGLAFMVGRHRMPAIATLLLSIALVAFMGWWYIRWFRATDPLAGMIFLIMPAMAWMGVAIALFIGVCYVRRTRRGSW